MSNIENNEILFQTIQTLRKNKTRPVEEKVLRMVERKYGINSEEAKRGLKDLLDQRIIVKVSFKGQISYRTAMRRKTLQQPTNSEVANPKRNKTRRRVLKTVRSLLKMLNRRLDNAQVKPRPRGRPPKIKVQQSADNTEDEGVTFKQIETWFKRKWSDQNGEVPDIQTAINEEVESERLVLLPNKKYILKNWRVSVKNNSKSIKLEEVEDGGGTTMEVGGDDYEEEGGEEKVKNDLTLPSNSCGLFSEDDNSNSELVINESSQGSYKRKSLPTTGPTSLVKKFKVENGEDIRLVTPDEGSPLVKDDVLCETCKLTTESNSRGESEPFLICKDCNISFHPSCLAYSSELAEKASKFPWECASCKTCVICGDAEEEQMLICDSCDRGYHMQCHDPPVSDKISSDEWLCSSCTNESVTIAVELEPSGEGSSNDLRRNLVATNEVVDEDARVKRKKSINHKNQPATTEKQNGESVSSVLLPTPNSSPSRTGEAEEENRNVSSIDYPLLPKLILSVPGNPPNATNWTVDDVNDYFIRAGFVEQAETFKTEEIDGKALLLLTRPDVLSGMKFKLGPALKIYAHIQRIQESSFSA